MSRLPIWETEQGIVNFFPCPKNASSTAFYVLAEAFGEAGVDGSRDSVFLHSVFTTAMWQQRIAGGDAVTGDYRIAIVRDPVDRFVSAYQNRVVELGEMGLAKTPEFDEFVNRFPENVLAAERRGFWIPHWHLRRQVDFFGWQQANFTHIFCADNLTPFVDLIEEISGHRVELDQINKSAEKPTVTRVQAEKIREAFDADYELFEEFF